MDPQQQQPQQPVIDITPESSGYRRGRRRHGPDDSGEYPAGRVEDTLRRRRFAFLVLFSILITISLVWYAMQPVEYRATGTIFLSRYGPVPAPVTEAELSSEVEMVRAQIAELTSSLARAAGISESAQAAEARRATLRERISVGLTGHSQVLRISFAGSSAKDAVETANLLMELYLQRRYRLMRSPAELIRAEAEANAVVTNAELALRELHDFDRRGTGAVAREEYVARSQKQTALETKTLETRAALRGFEAGGEEGQAAKTRAELAELEKAAAKAAISSLQAAKFATEREGLKAKADRALEDSGDAEHKMRDSRWNGLTLLARILSPAEAVEARRLELPWWMLLLWVTGAAIAASAGAWLVDLVNRPIYSEEEFSRVSGAPRFVHPDD